MGDGGWGLGVGVCNLKSHYRKSHAVTLSAAKRPGIHNVRRDASLRSA